jgi:hypothetical protein
LKDTAMADPIITADLISLDSDLGPRSGPPQRFCCAAVHNRAPKTGERGSHWSVYCVGMHTKCVQNCAFRCSGPPPGTETTSPAAVIHSSGLPKRPMTTSLRSSSYPSRTPGCQPRAGSSVFSITLPRTSTRRTLQSHRGSREGGGWYRVVTG